MTSAATILRTGLKELGTNWSWNWRLTVLKTIKMTLVGSLLTNFKMTVRTVSICSPLPLSIKAPVHWLSVGVAGARKRVHLWTGVCPPLLQLPASKIKQTFYQTCLFTGFWSTSSQTPLLATRGRKGENIHIHWWVEETGRTGSGTGHSASMARNTLIRTGGM